jgi:hypothetical protein
VPDYVQVDWGPEVAPRQAMGGAMPPDPGLVVSLGPLGLGFILQAGGSGYFRLGSVRPYLRSGRLTLVPGAPEFPYPAYAIHADGGGGEEDLLLTALAGL